MTASPGRGSAGRTVLGAAAVAAVVAAALTGAGPASARARPAVRCTATSGVIVAVDFGHWGGPLLRYCGSTSGTAYALVNQGGWQTGGTEHDGPGFVCRIGYAGFRHGTEYPTPAQQPCVLTPPVNAYWAFFLAGPGQNTWRYSQAGATSVHPQPGSVELWSFGATNLGGTAGSAVPAVSPARLRARSADLITNGPGPRIVNAPARPGAGRSGAGGQGGTVRAVGQASAGSSPYPTAIAVGIAILLAGAAIVAGRRRARARR
ncbi:MAG TPA: hypothetical protein VF843_16420 [Streptosporangiaceae bacterium]